MRGPHNAPMPLTPNPPWTLVSLRPQGGHGGLRAAAARHGGRLLALSPWRLQPRGDAGARQALERALAAEAVLFTSPAAVAAAAALAPLRPRPGQAWLAVGAGTARALRRHGVDRAQAPARMDSEGLLALPALAGIGSAGLVTAPGGRGMIAAWLRERGVELHRADVYERQPLAPPAAGLARLRALHGPALLALSSAEALGIVLHHWPADAAALLRRCAVVAASARLAAIAADEGLGPVHLAASARPGDLAAAAARALDAG